LAKSHLYRLSPVQWNTKRQRCWIDKYTKSGPTQRDRWQFSLLLWGAISLERNYVFEMMTSKLNSNDFEKILKRRVLKDYPGLRGDSTKMLEMIATYINRIMQKFM